MKWRYLFFCLMVSGFMACGNSSSETEKSALKFVYIAKQRDQSFHEAIVNGIKKQMAKSHVKVDVFSANDQHDVATQRKFIRQFSETKEYDGVMICPNDSEALIPDLAELDRAGIPFLVIDTPLVENEITRHFGHYCGFIGTDNLNVGAMASST